MRPELQESRNGIKVSTNAENQGRTEADHTSFPERGAFSMAL